MANQRIDSKIFKIEWAVWDWNSCAILSSLCVEEVGTLMQRWHSWQFEGKKEKIFEIQTSSDPDWIDQNWKFFFKSEQFSVSPSLPLSCLTKAKTVWCCKNRPSPYLGNSTSQTASRTASARSPNQKIEVRYFSVTPKQNPHPDQFWHDDPIGPVICVLFRVRFHWRTQIDTRMRFFQNPLINHW